MKDFDVITAEDGKKGVERAIAEKPDVILMNSIMPEMDGWEATPIIAFKSRNQSIPILAIAALSRPPILAPGLCWLQRLHR
jgi:two-component system, cell cycle response regulator DivK